MRSVDDTLTQDDEPDAVVRDVLHLDARDRGRGPRGVVMPTKCPHRCAQRRRQNILQPTRLQFRDHAVGAKATVGAHQADADRWGQTVERIAEEGGRPADAGGVARP